MIHSAPRICRLFLQGIIAVSTLFVVANIGYAQESVSDYFFQKGKTVQTHLVSLDSDLGSSYRYYTYVQAALVTVTHGPMIRTIYEPGSRTPTRIVYSGEISRSNEVIDVKGSTLKSFTVDGREWINLILPQGEEIIRWTETLNNAEYNCSARIKYIATEPSNSQYKKTVKVIKQGPYRTTVYYWALHEGLICRWERANNEKQLELMEAAEGISKRYFGELSTEQMALFLDNERKEQVFQEFKDSLSLHPDTLKYVSHALYDKVDSLFMADIAQDVLPDLRKNRSPEAINFIMEAPYPGTVSINSYPAKINWNRAKALQRTIKELFDSQEKPINRKLTEPLSELSTYSSVAQEYRYVVDGFSERDIQIKNKNGEWIISSGKGRVPESWKSVLPAIAKELERLDGKADKYSIHVYSVSINSTENLFIAYPTKTSTGIYIGPVRNL